MPVHIMFYVSFVPRPPQAFNHGFGLKSLPFNLKPRLKAWGGLGTRLALCLVYIIAVTRGCM